jgi:glycosyltransferase involved in cell wall biosynthesis
MNARISIVTISYNQATFLQDCISSVTCLHPERLQYVIVDPGSNDSSRDIIQASCAKFSHIVLDPDKGPADGLNKGFALCNGDIFGYINADDRFCAGALDFVLSYFDTHPNVDVLFGAIRMIDREGHPSRRHRTPDRINLRKFAYKACYIWQQATFFRRNAFLAVGGFNIANRIHWDSELVVDMILNGAQAGSVKKLLGDFRIYPESITGSNRLAEIEREQTARVRAKILAAGYPPYTPLLAKITKLCYKFNIRRHLSYLYGVESL